MFRENKTQNYNPVSSLAFTSVTKLFYTVQFHKEVKFVTLFLGDPNISHSQIKK